jgi:eukaryotic-like serine/threonine-protein kinase
MQVSSGKNPLPGPTVADQSASQRTSSSRPPVIPGYEIVEEIGRGGMGVVYRARQLNPERLVALKLLRDGALAGQTERARFRIEAEVAGRMHHANFVQIFEVGEHDGQTYLAMELIVGGGLDKLIAGQPRPANEAAELIRTLAIAVQHAHMQQVVHRDLKPANILLSGSAPMHVPKIADFGLAKRLDSNSTAWTQDGAVLGTASYMSPEQAAGQIHNVGSPADVYSLGAILYELLTGRPPFLADSWHEVIQQVLHADPTPPTRLQTSVPKDLETICLKCLEKEPRLRYESAEALADDLGRFLYAKPVTAVALSPEERLARLAARDGYELMREIGRGPRSVVYLAHYGSLRQPLAVKVFHAGVCTREEWDIRIRRGAEQWPMLAHPNVIAVQRAGWWDGAPFLAREYVATGSLAARLTGKPYPLLQALDLVAQLAEIVSYLHRQGAVHGNLKPSNVLLAADGIPRLVDLRLTAGLFLNPPSAHDSDATDRGYLAPELLRDPTAEPRFYTDIYGLGLILYELLTGRPPFAGRSAQETLEDPVPPSHINSKVAPQLEWFCMQCLAKNPWKRHERAYNVQTRMRHFRDALAGKP